MKNYPQFRSPFIYIVSLLYILLFVYAAVSKILDFENFRVQLGQSPLLSAYADYISIMVPASELLICFFLLIPKIRFVGLLLSYLLMVMFTAYIYIILNFSSFVPCSCGGILEHMSWNEHMIFNLAFILFSTVAILPFQRYSTIKKVLFLAFGGFFSIGFIFILFYKSENIIHHHNNFTRRFPHFPAVQKNELDLKSDTYYFAGSGDGKIYLGNYTAPLQILEIDSELKSQVLHNLKIDKMKLPFTAIQIRVQPPYFYLVDGNVPCIFKGNIANWEAFYVMRGDPYFSQFVVTDSTHIAFRTILKKTKTNTLGQFNLKDSTNITFESNLIQKQIDGVFDTDGQMLFDKVSQNLIYLYRYRNQFIVTNPSLKLRYRGNTIDTTAHAQIKVATISGSGEIKLAAPPLIVNNTGAVFNNILFVSSNLPGKYESLEMWKKASIIDAYNLKNRAYVLSFYIYDNNSKKMRSFYVHDDNLFALIGTKVVVYKLRKSVTENYKRR